MNRAKIEDTLLAMGVPAGIKGFTYIADAIQIFDEIGTDISITKELYPSVAKKRGTTPSRVERAIRHAFEVVRSRKGNPEVVEKYVGFTNCNNSSSLKTLYIRIKQDCKETEKKESVKETTKRESGTPITALEIREIIRQELRMFINELRVEQT